MSFQQILETEIIKNDCYKLKDFTLSKAPVVIDIGANIGIFSKYISILYPDAKVYSYELVKENYEEAKERLSGVVNIHLENKGIIGDSKPHGIFIHETNKGGHKVIFEDSSDYLNKDVFRKESKKEVQKKQFSYKRFDDLLREVQSKVDLLKLDCEGGEYDILFQCDRLDLFDRIDTIVMEVHGRHTEQFNTLKQILSNNYKYFLIKGHLIYCSNVHKF